MVVSGLTLLAVAILGWLWTGRTPGRGDLAGVTVVPHGTPSVEWLFEDVALTVERQAPLRCRLRRPAVTEPGERLPAVLVAGGLRTGRDAATVIGNGFRGISFACDYPWSDPGRGSTAAFLLRLPRTRAAIVATPDAHAIAAAYLISRPDVDSTRLAAAGVSLGVPTIAAWAAADERPRAVALLYGGGRLDLLLERSLVRHVKWGAVRAATGRLFAWLLAPLDPARNVAAIAPRPVLIVTAVEDQRIPPESFAELVAAAAAPKTIVRMPGRHVGGDDAALLAALTDTVTVWLNRTLPPP